MTKCRDIYESNLELLERLKGGDEQALEELIENNLALVAAISKKFLYRNYDYNDIFQTGCLGLIKAINNFD